MPARDVRNEAGMSLGDIYGALRRRRGWFLIPAALGVVASLVLALTLPAEYEAAATVTVEPPVIPDKLASNTIASDTETRYENLKLQLLARDSLSSIITDFNLFEGATTAREVQVEELRQRISIAPLPPAIVDPRKPVELNSFRVSFRWSSPKIAAEVSNRLARDFISANLRDRTSLADVARQITDYKENFQGELPEQLQINRERLERNRIDLANTESKLETARDQGRLLTQSINDIRIASAQDESDPSKRKRLLVLELNQSLAMGKTEKHPDVIHTRAEILRLEEILAENQNAPAAATREELAMRDKLRDYEVEAKVLAGEVERLKADIAEYEQRIENTPRRTAELDHLQEQYNNITESIRTLQLKQVEAEIGKTIETNNKGERFRVVESAEIPTSPISPNRPVWFTAGTLLGMMLGLGLLVLREMSDQSFHSVTDLQGSLGLPVLAAVPDTGAAARAFGRFRIPLFGGARV